MSLDVYLENHCTHCGRTEQLYQANITHNLSPMANEAGIRDALWHPESIEIYTAAQLIGPLEAGLSVLKSDRERCEAVAPANGWGTYDGFVRFVKEYLEACKANPTARVSVSR